MEKQIQQTFETFYKQHRLYVLVACRRKFKHEEDALDLESLVWIEVHRCYERFYEVNALKFLNKLISWRANDLYRSRYRAIHKNTELVEDHATIMHMLEGVSQGYSEEDKMALSQMISKENPKDRQLLFGRFVEGLTWQELAIRHQQHRNTLQNRTDVLLERFRKEWTRHSDP